MKALDHSFGDALYGGTPRVILEMSLAHTQKVH